MSAPHFYLICTAFDDDDYPVVAHILDENGKKIDQGQGLTDTEASLAARALLNDEYPHGYRLEPIDDPLQHPIGRAFLEGGKKEEKKAPQPGPHARRGEQANKHLCPVCTHKTVCEIRQVLLKHDALLPVLSACGAFEAPLPEEVWALADQVSGIQNGAE